MKTILKYIIHLLLLLVLANGHLKAQNCEKKLIEAEELYGKGQLTSIDLLIKSCLSRGFTKDQQIRALDLLVNTELAQDNFEQADDYTILLLQANPLFETSGSDSSEFKYHMNRFRTRPIMRIGAFFGMNLVNRRVMVMRGVDNAFDRKVEWQPAIGINTGFLIHLVISKNFELKSGLGYQQLRLNQSFQLKTTRYSANNLNSDSGDFNSIYNYSNVLLEETYNSFVFPLEFVYGFDISRNSSKIAKFVYHPIIGFGINYHIGLSDSFNKERQITDLVGTSQKPITSQQTDLVNEGLRQSSFATLNANVGIRLVSGSSMFQLQVDFQYGLSNLRNTNTDVLENDESRELLFKYGYIESDFSINVSTIQISYLRSIYNPKKLYR